MSQTEDKELSHQEQKLALMSSVTGVFRALQMSTEPDNQLEARFGTPAEPKSYHGPAANKENVRSWSSQYDRTTGKVTVFDAKGGSIEGTPAEAELFLAGQVIHGMTGAADIADNRSNPE
jgi:hypothetical protein